MKKAVVDASVALKWFVPEVHSAAAARLLDGEVALYAPDLIASEFGNTVWKKVRRRELSLDEAQEILDAFTRLPLETHRSAALLTAAFTLAVDLDRSVYDCLYLAAAVAEECALVTADAKFHAAVAASPLALHIRWVEDELF